MSGYTKLFHSILASTIWREDAATRLVWITMLAMTDKRGIVEGSVPGLADFARVPVDECRRALANLMAPDRDSRSKDRDGRRVVEVEGGWQLINHRKYREKMSADERREYLRQKQADYRAKNKADVNMESTNVDNVSDKYTRLTDPDPDPDPDKSSTEQSSAVPPTMDSGHDREHQDSMPTRATVPREPEDNPKVLLRLAHEVLDRIDAAGGAEESDKDALKTAASRAGLRYDGDRVRVALDQAAVQRRQQSPADVALRAACAVLRVVSPAAMPIEEFNRAVYAEVQATCAPKWRDEVVAILFRPEWYRLDREGHVTPVMGGLPGKQKIVGYQWSLEEQK